MKPYKTYKASDGRTVELIGKPSEELLIKALKAEIDRRLRIAAEAAAREEKQS